MSSVLLKGGINLNGVKYLLISTVILMLLVYILTSCVGGQKPVDRSKDGSTTDINFAENEYTPITDAPEIDYSDPDEADNTWAMFLINEENPLPRRYDDVIKTQLVDTTYREYLLDERAAPYYIEMLEAARADGVDLLTVSAYRTYDYQKNNFNNNVETRMEEGMTYDEAYKESLASVQLPGQSEHNAGLAVDILCNEYNSMDDDGFENTESFKWLDEHAAEYGFILRYPKGKQEITKIIYEPWHYRFVGEYYAKDIKESGLCMEEYFEQKGWLDENGAAVSHTIYLQNPDVKMSSETYTAEAVMGDALPDSYKKKDNEPAVSSITVLEVEEETETEAENGEENNAEE